MLDDQIACSWHALAMSAATWDAYDAERAQLLHSLRASESSVRQQLADLNKAEQDIPVTFDLKCGQVEALEPGSLCSLKGSAMLKKSVVQALNDKILQEGQDALHIMQDSRAMQKDMHAAHWDIDLDSLAAKHKQEAVRELQLLHIGRDVAKLWDSKPSMQTTPAKHMELTLSHSKLMHVRRCI